MSPAKHSLACLPRKMTTGQTERQTDGQTDAGQSDPYVPLCFADKKDSCISSVFNLKIIGVVLISPK